jgi:integrase
LRLLTEELPAKIILHEITDKEVCKRRDGDPTEHIDKTREIDEAISILAIPQAQKLLAACVADSECRPLLAATTIGLFAGLRTSELAALDWQDVHLTGKQQFIEVAARKAKTRQRRIVSISDNLSSWLKPVARVAGPGRSRPLPRTA